MSELLKNFVQDESGQDLAEYALLLALIAIAVIAAITMLSEGITDRFNTAASAVNGDADGT